MPEIVRSSYELALLLHLLTVVATFAASGVLHFGLIRMRTAGDVSVARDGAGLVRTLAPRMPLFIVALLVTGGWLTAQRWTWSTPWVATAVIGLVLMGALSGAVLKPRFGKVGAALAATAQQKVEGDLAATVRDPIVWTIATLQPALATGILAVMALKPAPVGCAVVMAVAIGVGLLVARATKV